MNINRHIFITVCSLLFYVNSGNGQTFSCGTSYFESLLTQTDPGYSGRKQLIESAYLDSTEIYWDEGALERLTDVKLDEFKVPIVVHLVGDNATFSINLFTAQSVIKDLNDRFRKKTGTPGDGEGVDTQISFCLAIKDANGYNTTGVLNIGGSLGPYCKNDESQIKTNVAPAWNNAKFLNIWVCDLSNCNDKAWATPPAMYFTSGNSAARIKDGIVCDINSFNAKVLVHEIGHWLNVRHTFGDSSSSCGVSENDDGCKDTPWCTGSASGFACNTIHAQCTAKNLEDNSTDARQIENYMDDSDGSCQNMFTLGQKFRMQYTLKNIRNQLANTSTCPGCYDGIKNGDEVGVDCGGSCTNPCATDNCFRWIHFKVNNQSTFAGEIINVCNNANIAIKPTLYSHPECPGWWSFSEVQRLTPEGLPNAYYCQWRPLKQKYLCTYYQLSLSVQECDQNKNLIGTEFKNMVNFPMLTSTFNLYDYLDQIGNPVLEEGKYYRIKISPGGNQAYSSYIKLFKSSVSLSSTTITDDQYADNITMTNSSVNTAIKIVAKNGIEIFPSSSLTSGSYYTQEYDCSQIGGFRGVSGSEHSVPVSNVGYLDSQEFNSSSTPETLAGVPEVRVMPNPSQGLYRIQLEKAPHYPHSIHVVNSLGNVILKIENPSTFEIDINITSQPPGIYIIHVTHSEYNYAKKIIKQ